MSEVAAVVAMRGEGKTDGYVYVLHFRIALMGGRKYSRHYVGWARNWIWRIQAHRAGTSRARIMEVCRDRGITFEVAVVAQRLAVGEMEVTGRDLERYIKRQRHHARYCPLCGGTKLQDYRD